MKTYLVHYTGGIISPAVAEIKAPNKTVARREFKAEYNPYCKITKIEEK